jgi:Glycosyltransferase family 87
VRGWIGATALLTFLVACSAGTVPWLAATAGAFRPPDFAQDVAGARAFANGEDPYGGNVAARHAAVLGVNASEGYAYLPHPPFAILLATSLSHFSFTAAARYWFAASVALCFVLAAILAGLLTSDTGRRLPKPWHTLIAFIALLLWPPVLYNLEKGQFSILLAVLMAIAWRSLEHRDSSIGGLWLGLAAAVKVFPALMAALLLFRRRRAAISLTIVAVAATTLPCFWIGLHMLPEFVGQSAGNLSYWQTWPAVTYSFHGLAARTFVGSEWSRAIVRAPAAATAIGVVVSVMLVGIASRATLHCVSDHCEAVLFAIWCILLVTLNPLAMGHNGVLLALPIVLIGKALADDSRVWPKFLWSAGCVLVSIPRQTIFALAPLPVTPARSFAVVALPLWGTLLLFSAGIAIASARAAADRMTARLTGVSLKLSVEKQAENM